MTSSNTWHEVFAERWPLIATVHFPALPGAPNYCSDWQAVEQRVINDARACIDHGADALMLENFGDVPFYPGGVPPVTVAHFTALACHVRRITDRPLGINVLRSDSAAALAIATAVRAQFIRVNVLCGARLTDQGIIEGTAHELLRQRRNLGAGHIAILADVQVKHSAPLAPRPLEEEIRETLERGGADGVIITGAATGSAVQSSELACARGATRGAPLLVGSGVTSQTVAELANYADGFIVGTALKRGGDVSREVDPQRVTAFCQALSALRARASAAGSTDPDHSSMITG